MNTQKQILTNWIVISGAPSSGKTSVIIALEKDGFKVVHDIARLVLQENLKSNSNLTAEEIQYQIHTKTKAIVKSCNPEELILFDYGLPDNIVFQKFSGSNLIESHILASEFQYRMVFILESVGFKKDGIRDKDESNRDQLHRQIWDSYIKYGYTPVLVPKSSISDRVDFIQKSLREDI